MFFRRRLGHSGSFGEFDNRLMWLKPVYVLLLHELDIQHSFPFSLRHTGTLINPVSNGELIEGPVLGQSGGRTIIKKLKSETKKCSEVGKSFH